MSVRANFNEVRRNHTAAGRIPSGAVLERSMPATIAKDSTVSVVLMEADFTTSTRVAEAVNGKFGERIALPTDGGSVLIRIPATFREEGRLVEFVSQVELLEIEPDVIAKVIINERTGTVVVGGAVSIGAVAISHGGLNIEIQSTPFVSQPLPWSHRGETVSTQMTSVYAGEDSSRVVAFEGAATVQEVARALNELKVTPRDIIAIFQALKRSGALNADLVII
jgi:flagellar P-ring protein precursor FlgI